MDLVIEPHSRNTRVGTQERYREMYRQSIEEPAAFWGRQAQRLAWFHPFHSVLDVDAEEVDFAWYSGGRLNASFNCVDRHAAAQPEKAAIIWAGNEPGDYRTITFRELKHQVSRMANVLRSHGVQQGDRVCIYLPWLWYHDVVGDKRCDVVDTWWQTETGGILITPLPGLTPMKPGSAATPFFGVKPVLLDAEGKVLEGNGVSGNLCLASAWPGQARTIWGDHRRFRDTYYSGYSGLYFTGDGANRDQDGYYWLTGRVDDVLNVSGHRIGTAELETALMSHEAVAEAAVVGYPHEIKGTGIFSYVTLKPHCKDLNEAQIVGALKEKVRHAIGPIAAPDRVSVVSGLPKTRSGKVMRRILRKIACGEFDDLGDVTTLAEPGVVEEIVAAVRG